MKTLAVIGFPLKHTLSPLLHNHLFGLLGIDARYQGSLFFAPRLPEELAVEASGITLLMDPMTASRADGVGLDVVETPQGYSFRIDTPNAPQVRE